MKTEIQKTIDTLKKGNLILYPTDTVWGIGCDATNPEAVKKVYALKQRADSKALICLVSDVAMLEKYVDEVPDAAYDIIRLADKPVTIVYDNPVGVAPNLVAADNTLAIRVAGDEFCQQLIKTFRKPIVSTSANISGEPAPMSFAEISPYILKGVDYIVPLHRDKRGEKPSSIIKIGKGGLVKIIRQ